jgi:hypothetical protein
MKHVIQKIMQGFGFRLVRDKPKVDDPRDEAILNRVRKYTMTSQERLLAVIDATRYLARNQIPGAIVECGVWRGGCSMAAALTLLQENDMTRDLYLFDTFSGMTPPTSEDISLDGRLAIDQFPKGETHWCAADLDDVRNNMYLTSYPSERMHFIVGPVENTISVASPPSEIALLRLDTDWYESTLHELIHLFPRLTRNGVLLIDDYGHWQGARKAVDEYFASQNLGFLLHRTDYSGRGLVKTN